jgi:CBS domain-containing protein
VAVLDGGRLAGMFTERDYARNLILKDRSSRSTPVRDVMTRRVAVVNPVQTLDECMALMTEKHLRHLPVMEQGELVGILSIGDLVKATIEDQQFMIEQLVNYISG